MKPTLLLPLKHLLFTTKVNTHSLPKYSHTQEERMAPRLDDTLLL